ncbi:MAG: hypothetical protein SOV50_02975 [Lentihominibacter sp.]|nr:hypothetical protein [Clostridiales bacterium]MDY2679605.1 hypothetical protein [Lentihominibacter sp.]
MFRDMRRKKLRNRVLYLAIAAIVLVFGLWINFYENKKVPDEDAVKTIEADTQEQSGDIKETAEKETGKGTDTEEVPETYLIKEVDGVVKVFLCDSEDNKELYLITSIPYDLLSESDQQMFSDGVELETEDDLGAFLQNFDS